MFLIPLPIIKKIMLRLQVANRIPTRRPFSDNIILFPRGALYSFRFWFLNGSCHSSWGHEQGALAVSLTRILTCLNLYTSWIVCSSMSSGDLNHWFLQKELLLARAIQHNHPVVFVAPPRAYLVYILLLVT